MGKYLDFYKKCMLDNKGWMPANGLCAVFGDEEMELFYCDSNFRKEWEHSWYWGYNGRDSGGSAHRRSYQFSPLRQDMTLLLAAIHGEDFNELKK